MNPTEARRGAARRSFALSLLGALPRGLDENLCVAASSVYDALLLARAGAEGETARELDVALGVEAASELPKPELRAESRGDLLIRRPRALFCDPAVRLVDDYRRRLEGELRAAVKSVDFRHDREGAAQAVNTWIAASTEDRIRELVAADSLDPDTRLVLVDCLLMRAAWSTPFDAIVTDPGPFQLESGEEITVQYMRQNEKHLYLATPEAHVVGLRLQGAGHIVLVAVARDSVLRPPVPDPDELRRWLDQLAPRRVELRLPRTTTGTSTSLVSALEALGIHRLFAGAELGRAIHSPPLDVDDIRHALHLALTEEGIDVAAATAILALLSDDEEVPVALTVDRPFFFCICDRELGDVDVLGVIARP